MLQTYVKTYVTNLALRETGWNAFFDNSQAFFSKNVVKRATLLLLFPLSAN